MEKAQWQLAYGSQVEKEKSRGVQTSFSVLGQYRFIYFEKITWVRKYLKKYVTVLYAKAGYFQNGT